MRLFRYTHLCDLRAKMIKSSNRARLLNISYPENMVRKRFDVTFVARWRIDKVHMNYVTFLKGVHIIFAENQSDSSVKVGVKSLSVPICCLSKVRWSKLSLERDQAVPLPDFLNNLDFRLTSVQTEGLWTLINMPHLISISYDGTHCIWFAYHFINIQKHVFRMKK